MLATLDGHAAANGKFFSESDALSYCADTAVSRLIAGIVLVEQQINAIAPGGGGGGPAEAVSRDLAAAAAQKALLQQQLQPAPRRSSR